MVVEAKKFTQTAVDESKQLDFIFLFDVDGIIYDSFKTPSSYKRFEQGKFVVPDLTLLEGKIKKRWGRKRILAPKLATMIGTSPFALAVKLIKSDNRRFQNLKEFPDLAESYQKSYSTEAMTGREDDIFHLTKKYILEQGFIEKINFNPGVDDTLFKAQTVVSAAKRAKRVVIAENDPYQAWWEALVANLFPEVRNKTLVYSVGEKPDYFNLDNQPQNLFFVPDIKEATKHFDGLLKRSAA